MRAGASPHRVALAPEVPTFRELGFHDVLVTEDLALLAPAGTSDHILDRMGAACSAAMNDPEVRERLAALGTGGDARPRAEWPAYLQSELARWGDLVRSRGIGLQ